MAEPSDSITIHQVHGTLALDEALVVDLVRTVLDSEEAELESLSLVLADHKTVDRLNRDYLGHDYSTDVLSFDYRSSDDEGVDGEVYVDLDTANERHDAYDATFEHEACRYVVHGLLHLIGYDDASADDRTAMRRLEDRYLEGVV